MNRNHRPRPFIALAAFALLLSKAVAAEQPDHFDPKVQEYLKTFKSGGELGNQSPAPAPADAPMVWEWSLSPASR